MRVLVAGGTGRLGTQVADRLAQRGVVVRVLTRDPRRAEHLHESAVEVAEGDVRHAETLPAALAGVDVVVSAVHGFAGPGRVSPRSVDQDGNANLVAAAASRGAAVVLMSVVGASQSSPMELLRCKYAAEQAVMRSGVPWTVVRATAFVELWAELVAKGIVFGRGDNPVNFVSVTDVADLVTEVVLDPAHRGDVVEIGGPDNVSLNELAAARRALDGKPAGVRHVPRGLLRALAPLHRLPRAALVMDTTDMTFSAGPGRRIGGTDVKRALAQQASGEPAG